MSCSSHGPHVLEVFEKFDHEFEQTSQPIFVLLTVQSMHLLSLAAPQHPKNVMMMTKTERQMRRMAVVVYKSNDTIKQIMNLFYEVKTDDHWVS